MATEDRVINFFPGPSALPVEVSTLLICFVILYNMTVAIFYLLGQRLSIFV